jgi:hypothetical protein
MKRTSIALAFSTFLFLISGFVMAAPITVGIGSANSWSLGTGWGHDVTEAHPEPNWLYPVQAQLLEGAFSINQNAASAAQTLKSGESLQFLFGKVDLDEEFISYYETDNLSVVASIDLDLPEKRFVTIPGQGTAVQGPVSGDPDGYYRWVPKFWWIPDCTANQWACELEWVPPEYVDLTISFQPVSFAYGDGVLTFSLNDVQILDRTPAMTPVYGTVSYSETAMVPEPSALLFLLSVCLAAAGMTGRIYRGHPGGQRDSHK